LRSAAESHRCDRSRAATGQQQSTILASSSCQLLRCFDAQAKTFRSDFGLTLVPAMASSYASGCTLIPLRGNIFRRIGYLRARRHFVSRPMREFVLWLRTLTKSQGRKSSGVCAV